MADDLNDIFVDAIDRKVWQTAEDEFAGIPLATGPSTLGELCQQINLTVNGERHSARGGRASVFIHVVADKREVVCGSVQRMCINPYTAFRSSS
jgi:hypothetical protein